MIEQGVKEMLFDNIGGRLHVSHEVILGDAPITNVIK
jgi:hypothetical protein